MRPSAATMSAMRQTNHGSTPDRAATRPGSQPRRSASASQNTRSGVGSATRSASSSAPAASAPAGRSRPVWPCSSDRRAFCSASSKVVPSAMASPTDFMRVVSSQDAPSNFSKAKRGTLTTQ